MLAMYFAGVVYLLSSGIFAIRFPDKWQRATWTATRGISPNASPSNVRIFGVVHVTLGIVLGTAIVYFV